MSSVHAMVTTNGRVFYIMDEGLRSHIFMPAHWTLIARDAFNGTILWKRDIKDWQTHVWPMKSGPGQMPRRLVAVGDTVYVTLGYNAPVTAINAATGRTIRTYEGTKATEEIIVSDDVLYLLNDPDKEPSNFVEATDNWGKASSRANTGWAWTNESPERFVMAVDGDSGRTLWKYQTSISPQSLTVGPQRIYLYNGDKVVALDKQSGKEAWTSQELKLKPSMTTGYTHRMVYSDGVLAFCHTGSVDAFDAATGKHLWKNKLMGTGHKSPNDMFIVKGLVWSAATGKAQTKGTEIKAIDLHTGEEVKRFTASNLDVYFMHQRCYPGRATEKYLITSGTGTEFYKFDGPETMDLHHYVRGSCIYGIMPANGLLYKPADSCACHYQSKLTFMMALASGQSTVPQPATDAERLVKGPAYNKISNIKSKISNRNDWAAYRHDSQRSGATKNKVPSKLREKWKAQIGGTLSSVTVADGMTFVAAVDRHKLYALDNSSGKTGWTYTAGGRIDSPPTIHNGMAIFGSADGWVYCLRASDGELVWRYQVAPGKDKLFCRQQVESLWPVNGSVLVHDGTAYCLAGRNMFFDGGMRLVRLDATSGRKISETVLNEIDPETGDNLQAKMPGKAMPVANPDILSCDGKFVYMGAQKFGLDGKRVDIDAPAKKEGNQDGPGRHLFNPTGFLDDTWFHRSYMMYGLTGGEGHGEYTAPPNITPVGRMLVFDDTQVYGFRAAVYSNTMKPRPYHYLYSADRYKSEQHRAAEAAATAAAEASQEKMKNKFSGKGKVNYQWKSERPSVLANAMVLADDTVFMAGPPDVADEEKGFGINFEEDNEMTRAFAAQDRAWQGDKGAILQAVSKTSGEKLAEYKLEHLPVFDGMAAAEGSLFIALKDGSVICMD